MKINKLLLGVACVTAPAFATNKSSNSSNVQSKAFAECEERLATFENRQVLVRTQELPYFSSRIELEQFKDGADSSSYAVRLTAGDNIQFSIGDLLEFWLSELLFADELDHALKPGKIITGGVAGKIPRRSLRVDVVHRYISKDEAQAYLKRFIYRLENLRLVGWNWNLDLKPAQVVSFVRSLGPFYDYWDQEILSIWKHEFNRFYARLDTRSRLLLCLPFFDPNLPRNADELIMEKYLFQGNDNERDRTSEQLKNIFREWFTKNTPPHLNNTPYPISASRSRYYVFDAVVAPSVTLPDGSSIEEAPSTAFDPHRTLEHLNVDSDLYEKITNHGFRTQDEFIFRDAQSLVDRLALDREEFISLAEALFEDGIFLKIDSTWDRKKFNILRERTHLRMPRRSIEPHGRDLSPVPRRLYDEF